jgi:hypothetical protein
MYSTKKDSMTISLSVYMWHKKTKTTAVLDSGAAPAKLDCKIYRQTEAELKALKEYIDENLAKGYIVETNSPYASPVFFPTKSDGKLCPIVNY